jgi:hypothetical protein
VGFNFLLTVHFTIAAAIYKSAINCEQMLIFLSVINKSPPLLQSRDFEVLVGLAWSRILKAMPAVG